MKFEIYKDKRGEWRWRLKARNGKILAVSSEGYASQIDVHRCVSFVIDTHRHTPRKLMDFL